MLSRESYQAWKALNLYGFVSLPIQTEIKLGNTCIMTKILVGVTLNISFYQLKAHILKFGEGGSKNKI